MQGQWTLLDETGGTAVHFTSFIGLGLRNEGSTLNYPVEQGSFVDYNKTQTPKNINVTLGVQGLEQDFAHTLATLDLYKTEAIKLAVVTPSTLYPNFTLESYTYPREIGNGAGMLVVELNLVEVREVATRVTVSAISGPRNPTSAVNRDRGKTQAETPSPDMAGLLGSLANTGLSYLR